MTLIAKTILQSGRELIAFRIGEQEFTVNVMNVREIRGWTPATPMPHSPPYMLGVINLRGVVLPIIDLSARLGMKPAEPSARHVIIVAQVRDKFVGLLVDAVSDILTVTEENIQPTPEVASDHERSFARGILAIDNRMICLVELEAIFPDSESEAA
jgi:purine-binding chemotaxis protein CheW